MSSRPINTNKQARKVAAQGPGVAQLDVSFESTSVSLGAGEALDVSDYAYVFAYGGGAVTCCDTPGGTYVALEDRTGVAVTVTTARLIEVRGVRFVKFAGAASVVVTG